LCAEQLPLRSVQKIKIEKMFCFCLRFALSRTSSGRFGKSDQVQIISTMRFLGNYHLQLRFETYPPHHCHEKSTREDPFQHILFLNTLFSRNILRTVTRGRQSVRTTSNQIIEIRHPRIPPALWNKSCIFATHSALLYNTPANANAAVLKCF